MGEHTPRPCVVASTLLIERLFKLLCTSWECHARSAKFWMSANTQTLVLALFHRFLVPYQGFFGFPSI